MYILNHDPVKVNVIINKEDNKDKEISNLIMRCLCHT